MTAITHRGAIAYYDVMETLKDLLLFSLSFNDAAIDLCYFKSKCLCIPNSYL